MAKLTRAQREWRPGMKKKQRSTKMMFASTVLVCEALLAVFVTLAAFGLKRGEPAVVLSLGAAVALLCIFNCALLGKKIGYIIGWILQVVFFLSGFILVDMFYLAAAFALCWWFALSKGEEIDVENKRRAAAQEAWEKANPEQA
ncbi:MULTISPECIES: DUF4233 domain-containing protein [Glutamicibacter]|uniref:Uncharacterized protein DUF4233 n=2 Tax=Glutamicibacter TaxID=1742989 RepID=A0ABX4MZ58_9MICC|nr:MULTISPECIES: DUF4233 domain-containing protein [Glutamicibacter]KWR72865.1 hypothetical protein RN04_05520 [Arthrobacter sp. W1]PJJ44010.1 uncharacterized protein DUF4233 [Glutamicibacter mysorens]QEP07390.1 DUF4233 domain-containing protein [Glutamicibacter sp. ZJUTW]UTM47123.1 DUF4233 domain-containing protein [Glutamicibacter mysorens]WIV42512.1 DUF4233 domain-containing protein [Glutamicibacter nicotianae]